VKHAGLEQDTDPEAYLPYRQLPFGAMGQRLSLVVRTRSGLAAMAPIIRSVVSGLDRNQPVGTISAMEDVIAESVAPRRLGLGLVVAFAVVALALTSACVYGVMSYLVAQRTREIGVRMAFGASPRRVLVLVLRQVGRLAAIGIALGFAGALALTRLMTSLLFGVSPTEPLVYVGVATILVAVTLAAVAVPSSRAARVDPIVALRES
jgi:putative ABC transport system permease protein